MVPVLETEPLLKIDHIKFEANTLGSQFRMREDVASVSLFIGLEDRSWYQFRLKA